MEFNFYYDGEDAEKLKKEAENAYNEIKKYFLVDLDEFSICVHKTRESYNKQLNKKTEPWDIANADYNGRIDILYFDALEKESSHKKDEFFPVLKHELTHLFMDKLSQGKMVPRWLEEGVSYYISGQYKNALKRNYYIEENLCRKFATQQGWNSLLSYDAYQVASLFTYFLIKTFSFEKIKELVASLDKNYYYPFFKEKFEKVFGNSIEKTEKDFLKCINQKS